MQNKQRIIFGLFLVLIVGSIFYVTYQKQSTPPTQPIEITEPRKIGVYPDVIPGNIVTLKKLTLAMVFDYFTMFSAPVRKSMEFPDKISLSYIEYHITYELDQMSKGLLVVYTIWDNKENKLIGAIQIRDKKQESVELFGQLGMWLNEAYWGGGRIQNALFLISKTYFDAWPSVQSYNAYVRPWNIRSFKSMLKFGFKKVRNYIEDGKVTRYILELTRDVIHQKEATTGPAA